MFLGLRTVVYRVDDLQKAKEWYGNILNEEPAVDLPDIATFNVGPDRLMLSQADQPFSGNRPGTVAYWAVSDIRGVYKHLIENGAREMDGIQDRGGGLLAATVEDPFGNILGIGGTGGDVDNKAIEEKPSRTALWTTQMRAFSTGEKNEEIRGQDHLAEIFLSTAHRDAFKSREDRPRIKETYFVIGVYEYVMARTRIFDRFFKEALKDNAGQVVFLGAGYDSRPYRFRELIGDVRLFELDIAPTQNHKKQCLVKAGIEIPSQLTYVPINFNTESMEEKLMAAGFDPTQKTLFMWEGVTFYLASEAVDATLNFINSNSPTGSTVAFDYIALWPGIYDAYGVKELIEFNARKQSGESGNAFAIEEGTIESFLSERGFEIEAHQNPEELEKNFLTLKDGTLFGHVTGSFRIVQATTTA